jgi:hypothetical protein
MADEFKSYIEPGTDSTIELDISNGNFIPIAAITHRANLHPELILVSPTSINFTDGLAELKVRFNITNQDRGDHLELYSTIDHSAS